MPAPNWANLLKSYWCVNVPLAVGGVIPNWNRINPIIELAFKQGSVITYTDASGQQFKMDAQTAAEYRFIGRFAFGYPSANKARCYRISINRSTGAVTSTTTDFTIS